MNAYEELAGHRFSPGRDYDKRSVETFRARVLNLVDELLNQVTQMQDEVADLRERARSAPAEVHATASAPAPVVPTTWLEALAGTAELPDVDAVPETHAYPEPAVAMAGAPAAFPAPAVASWLAELDSAEAGRWHDLDDDDDRDDTAGSTAELLLAAAGNAVAVQAAAMAGRNGHGSIDLAPVVAIGHDAPVRREVASSGDGGRPPFSPATAVTPPVASPTAPTPPVPTAAPATPAAPPPVAPAPLAAAPVAAAPAPAPAPAVPAPIAAATAVLAPEVEPDPPAAAGPSHRLTITPGDQVLAGAATTDLARLPIVLDDGLPADGPLPAPVRHWGGWMRDVAGA